MRRSGTCDVPPELSSVSIESPASFRRFGRMKKRFTEAQIVGFLREVDAGVPVLVFPDDRIRDIV